MWVDYIQVVDGTRRPSFNLGLEGTIRYSGRVPSMCVYTHEGTKVCGTCVPHECMNVKNV